MISMNNITRFSGYAKINRTDAVQIDSTAWYKGPYDKKPCLYEFYDDRDSSDLTDFRSLKKRQQDAYEAHKKLWSSESKKTLADAIEALGQFLKQVIG